MGHIIVGSNGNYKPQDPEYYRKRYEDKALPFLRLEAPTPSDTDEIITTLKEQHRKEIENLEARLKEQHQKEMEQRDKQIEELQAAVQRIQETTEFLNTLDPQHIAEIVQEANIHKKSLADLRIGEPIEIPFSVMKELLKQAQTEGKDQIEINPNRLKKMMDEENKKVRKTPKSRDK
jgi:exonuclease VII large subunit